jgi:hypothetical protein
MMPARMSKMDKTGATAFRNSFGRLMNHLDENGFDYRFSSFA